MLKEHDVDMGLQFSIVALSRIRVIYLNCKKIKALKFCNMNCNYTSLFQGATSRSLRYKNVVES